MIAPGDRILVAENRDRSSFKDLSFTLPDDFVFALTMAGCSIAGILVSLGT